MSAQERRSLCAAERGAARPASPGRSPRAKAKHSVPATFFIYRMGKIIIIGAGGRERRGGGVRLRLEGEPHPQVARGEHGPVPGGHEQLDIPRGCGDGRNRHVEGLLYPIVRRI